MHRPSSVSYHFVPGVALKEFTLKDASGGKDMISTNEKEPSILKTGRCARGARVYEFGC